MRRSIVSKPIYVHLLPIRSNRQMMTEITQIRLETIDIRTPFNFNKYDFDSLSKEENIPIDKISLINQHDDKIIKKEIYRKN